MIDLLIFGLPAVGLALLMGWGVGYEQAKRSAYNEGWDNHAKLIEEQTAIGLRSIGWRNWEQAAREEWISSHDNVDRRLQDRWGRR